MAWGLFPLFFAAASMSLERTAALAAIYPATWGLVQLGTGALSDRIGRKWLIATGMWTQAGGIAVIAMSETFVGFAVGAVLLGVGTAMVYPTLLAGIGDVAAPVWRASADRCVPLLARSRLRDRCRHRRRDGGPARLEWCVLDRRGTDVHLRADRRVSYAGDARDSRCLVRKENCNMNPPRRWATMWLLLLLLMPRPALAQIADDSREKFEKVGDILAALQAEPGKRIADVGAGEGFYSLRIARAVRLTGRVMAVDVSEKHLEKLRARLQQDNVTNVDVVVAAVDDPRLPENAFDAVLIYNAYHEMTEPEPILKVIFRALRPGGRLVMSEPLHDNVRSATRAQQVKEYEIGPNFVQQEVQAVGFAVIEQRPDFLAFARSGHKGGFWLMVARKPDRQ